MTNQEFIAFVKKNPISFGCGLFSLAIVVAIYFTMDLIPAAEADLQTKTDTADRYALNIKNSERLKEQYDTLAAANKEIESRAMKAPEIGPNTRFFYRLPEQTGVTIVDFKTGVHTGLKPAAKNIYVPLSFRLTVSGDLTQVMSVLRILESGTHFCRVTSASLTASAMNRNGPLTLALGIDILGLP